MKLDLLILSATELVISYFLNLFPNHTQALTKTGLKLLSGKLNHKTYDLLITGPGIFNASHALSAYLEHSRPLQIIQMGIAGIFEQVGLNIGDIAVATESHYIHTGVGATIIKKDPLPFDLITGKASTRKGIYPFDPKKIEKTYIKLSNGLKRSNIQITNGLIITVSSITSSKKDADMLYKAYSPVMEAMEGAASAHIASLYNVPMMEIRSASNYVGERDKSKWNFDLAVKHLAMGLSCL